VIKKRREKSNSSAADGNNKNTKEDMLRKAHREYRSIIVPRFTISALGLKFQEKLFFVRKVFQPKTGYLFSTRPSKAAKADSDDS